MCACGGERQPGCLRASKQPLFLSSHEVLSCGRGLRTWPFVWVPFTRWTAADLITAYCVHTHKLISTLQDKQQMRILWPLLSKSTSGLIWTAAHETDGRSARGQLCSCGQSAVRLRAFSTVASAQLRHRRPKVCRSIHRWDPRVQLVCIMEHVPLRQSIKCNLCPVTPEELKQPQGVVSTWPCEFQISPLLAPQDFLSCSIFKSLSTSWHISRTLCSLDHMREANFT